MQGQRETRARATRATRVDNGEVEGGRRNGGLTTSAPPRFAGDKTSLPAYITSHDTTSQHSTPKDIPSHHITLHHIIFSQLDLEEGETVLEGGSRSCAEACDPPLGLAARERECVSVTH